MVKGSDDVDVYDNIIHDNGVAFSPGSNSTNIKLHDNTIYNAAFGVRHSNLESGNRSVYIYRNKFYNPHWVGNFSYYHVKPNWSGGATTIPSKNIYLP